MCCYWGLRLAVRATTSPPKGARILFSTPTPSRETVKMSRYFRLQAPAGRSGWRGLWRYTIESGYSAAVWVGSFSPSLAMAAGCSPPSCLSRAAARAFRRFMMAPVPAGIRRPTITFSLRPMRSSTRPDTAASVSTLVVSWNDAAEMKERVWRLALVMPWRTGSPPAARTPSLSAFTLMSSNSSRSTCSPTRKVVSPGSVISTFCSIWRTITSMCLSLIFTPWSR